MLRGREGHSRRNLLALGVALNAVLLDIDGVLTVSWRALPGATDAIGWLRSEGVPFRLLTNTTELTRNQVGDQLVEAGLAVRPEEIVTAPLVTAAYVRAKLPGARCFVLAAVDLTEDLEGMSIVEDDADAVVVAGATEPFSAADMSRALRMVLNGAVLIAMHRSITWMTAGGMTLDAGVTLVAGLEEATGRKAVVCGKPSPECFLRSVELMGSTPARTAMVGDDVANDVMAAQRAGLTGVLVRTGKFRPEDLEGGVARPDHVVDSVGDLPDLVARLRG